MTESQPEDSPVPALQWSPPAVIKASAAIHGLVAAGLVISPHHWPQALQILAANHVAVGLCGMMPRAPLIGRTVNRIPVPTASPRLDVALTFDDGPDPDVTPKVLELLGQHDARASFFCIGKRVEQYPELAREIVARGHFIENHTYHHRHTFAFRMYRGLKDEILRAQDTIENVTGRRPRYFRPPAGMRNFILDPLLSRLDLTLVAWTRRGFDAVEGNPDRVVPRLVRGLSAGDILLLHDGNSARGSSGKPVVIESLNRLLALFDRRGLTGVALPPNL